MSTTIPQNDPHMAATSTEDFKEIVLITGDTPITTTDEVVADAVIVSADLPANSVVGRDVDGKLVLAVTGSVDPADDIAPIGITTATVKTGATTKSVAVYRSGCFNPAALNFDASYNTDAKKRLAFEGTGSDILIRKPGYPLA